MTALWLVIDLEATTEEGGWPLAEMEIIEIGATLVDASGHELDHFQRFVRPLRRPHLTAFCRELTHISQANIDSAQPFPTVWAQCERWLGPIASASPAGPAGATTIASSCSRNGISTAWIACSPACRTTTSSSASPGPANCPARWA